jgi:hypothetical protein
MQTSEAARHAHTGLLLLFLAMSLLEELVLLTDTLKFPQKILLALDSFVFTFGKDGKQMVQPEKAPLH